MCPGGEFAVGKIDLGGLEVYRAKFFKKIWETRNGGGPHGLVASFYEPTDIPRGFHLLGHFCKVNNFKAVFSAVLVAKDTTRNLFNSALKSPIDYTLIWTSKGLDLGQNVDGYVWLPIAPVGYKAIGHIVTTSPKKPSLHKVMCVRSDLTDLTQVDERIWGSSNINLYTTKPRSTNGLSVPTGTFLALSGSNRHKLACLKMIKSDSTSAQPNPQQIQAMIDTYAPLVYFHPNEEFFPSSVEWFFENGAKLYQLGKDPSPVFKNGENLPNKGSVDDAHLDLPSDESEKDRVKKGSLPDASAYIHVKSVLGGTFTDLAIWLYYPFNGGAKFQLGPFTIPLGKLGEHVGDWEHITLRIENYSGKLTQIYLSQHAKGVWVDASEFEFINGTRPVVYASLHGHSHYKAPNKNTHWAAGELDSGDKQMLMDSFTATYPRKSFFHWGFGLRDDTDKGGNVLDIAAKSSYQVSATYNNSGYSMPPYWLDYTGRWGPKVSYDTTAEVMKAVQYLPRIARKIALKVLKKLPDELFGEEGPEGPKMKSSWDGDENFNFKF